MRLAAGTPVGPCEILAPLGAGGMGEVYRARDPRLGREVAIKVLPEELSRDPERLSRFEKKARAATALNHPNILDVHDTGVEEGVPYIVSELLDGEARRLHRARMGLHVRVDLPLGALETPEIPVYSYPDGWDREPVVEFVQPARSRYVVPVSIGLSVAF